MSGCNNGNIVAQHTLTGGVVTGSTYWDTSTNPPTSLTQADFDALTLVCCPVTEADKEKVCLRPIGDLDPASIISGWQLTPMTTTFSDNIGTVAAITPGTVALFDEAMTDITATHEVTACPISTTIQSAYCVPAGAKKVAEKTAVAAK